MGGCFASPMYLYEHGLNIANNDPKHLNTIEIFIQNAMYKNTILYFVFHDTCVHDIDLQGHVIRNRIRSPEIQTSS